MQASRTAAYPSASLGLAALTVFGLAAAPAAKAQNYTLTTLANFSAGTGQSANSDLTLVGNILYGTTYQSGPNHGGTVYSVPITGGVPTLLTSFNGTDGSYPEAGLTLIGSTFYGTTSESNGLGAGEVFSLALSGGTPTVLGRFNIADGTFPGSSLTLVGSNLYGTASQGGTSNGGTIFSIPLSGGTPIAISSFKTTYNASYGSDPEGALTLSADGSTFYGTARTGGATGAGDGVVFSVPVTGGTPTDLATFSGADGNEPYGDLVLHGNTLYGTTVTGGAFGDGTVFSVPVKGGTPTVLTSFNGKNGIDVDCGLTLSADGTTLYGTTSGGILGNGNVFSLPVTGGMPTILASFNGGNGQNPYGDLTLGADGTLYGTTSEGGAGGNGTVFALRPDGGSAPVPEASSLISLGLLLIGSLGGLAFRAWRCTAVQEPSDASEPR